MLILIFLLCCCQWLIASDGIISILPLGDSITAGFHERPTGNYRYILEKMLNKDGFNVDYVGTQRRNGFFKYGEPVLGNPRHEGHPSKKIEYLIEEIDYAKLDADAVTLLIGTNNHWQSPDLETFVNKYNLLFNKLEMYDHVFVATVPKLGYKKNTNSYWTDVWVHNRNEVVIPNMNEAIKIAVAGRSNFTVVEYYDAFNEYIHLTDDKIHPNSHGHLVLGILFYRAIAEWLGIKEFDSFSGYNGSIGNLLLRSP